MVAIEKPSGRKKGTGRKKVEIKKIENKTQLNVTFSKRRQGLFTKARDLCVLCGGDVAVIVFSPTGRLYTFGFPSVDSVMDRLVKDSCFQVSQTVGFSQSLGACSSGYRLDNDEDEPQVIVESPQRQICSGFWWDLPTEDMGLDMLMQYKVSLEEIKSKACIQAQLMMALSMSQMDYSSINGRFDGNDEGIVHGFGEGTPT